MQRSKRQGFTLIELLIVVVVIALLASIAVVKFETAKQRAWRANGIGDLRKLAGAQEAFYSDSNRYAIIADTGTGPGQLNFQPAQGNKVLTLLAVAGGWSGTVDIPGAQQCGIFSGSAAPPAGMPAGSANGVPTCY
jgi:prepilin-type N-terminal cleavage/methylation domain-containing protein